jgi:hypothetical protein
MGERRRASAPGLFVAAPALVAEIGFAQGNSAAEGRGGMLPLWRSLESLEPVPRGAKGLTADGVFPNIPRSNVGCLGAPVKSRRGDGKEKRAGIWELQYPRGDP